MRTLIFDTETTGLVQTSLTPIDKQPEIIEFYSIDQEQSSKHFLIKPKKQISEEITRITGIKNDDLRDKPPFEKVAQEIKAAIESAEEIVAHNLSFDKKIIDIEMERCGLKVAWPNLICTVEQTEFIKGHRLTLGALYEHLFNEKFDGAHRAENDVKALARCFWRLRDLCFV